MRRIAVGFLFLTAALVITPPDAGAWHRHRSRSWGCASSRCCQDMTTCTADCPTGKVYCLYYCECDRWVFQTCGSLKCVWLQGQCSGRQWFDVPADPRSDPNCKNPMKGPKQFTVWPRPGGTYEGLWDVYYCENGTYQFQGLYDVEAQAIAATQPPLPQGVSSATYKSVPNSCNGAPCAYK